jgi:2,3-bisphosphoglycerate-dependent phosphoglycerate mutase
VHTRTLALLLVCCFIGQTFAADTPDSFTIYLVRHAEKQADGSRDPELTETGVKRSEKLANWFVGKDIENIWSSDYKRTRNTATPILAKLDINLTLYDPGNLTELTETLLAQQHNALVVGHSNTTPQVARLLCNCEIADMDESEYDRLIVVSVTGNETNVRTILQQ